MGYSIILDRDQDGRRIDHAIKSIWPELPLSLIMKALRKGEVRLDAKKVREPGTKIFAGQELYTPWPRDLNLNNNAIYNKKNFEKNKNLNLNILWQGEGAIIINKPSGLLVQPDTKGGDSVITRLWSMLNINNNNLFKPAAVHRLDRNTTGVLAAALHGDSLRELEKLFKAHSIKKIYRAVVTGRAPDFIEINAPLIKDAELNLVKVANNLTHDLNPDVKTAKSLCKLIKYDAQKNISLVEIELLTGRTHQARVHMAHINHAIIGDRKYGDFKANKIFNKVKRPLLHAYKLIFPELDNKAVSELSNKTFQAELPEDFILF